MDLLVATNNAHKLKEIRQILSGKFSAVYSLQDLGIEIEVIENGATFFDNALKKAKEVCLSTGYPALGDDTGLLVNALGGAPGVYSARYAGSGHDDAANNRKLMDKLAGCADRAARFATCVVLYYPDGHYLTGNGEVEGYITPDGARGENGFGYDALFYAPELGKTFGEATDEEKNGVSHRARALTDLLKKL